MDDEKGILPEEETPKEQETPEPNVPEQFRGKSVEELANMVLEKESQIGKQSNEVGDLRSQLDALRQQQQAVNQYQPQYDPYAQQAYPPQAYPTANQPQYGDDDYIPAGEVKKMVYSELEKERRERQSQESQRQGYEANMAFAEGRKYVKPDSKLFEGIEKDVEQVIWGSFVQSQYTPTPMSVQQLRNPETWTLAAQNIRLQRGQLDRIVPDPGKPVQHTPTEVPLSAKPVEEEKGHDVEWTTEREVMYRGLGVDKYGNQIATKEEVAEGLRKEREERARREE